MGRDGNDPVLQRPPSPLKLFFRKMPARSASFAKLQRFLAAPVPQRRENNWSISAAEHGKTTRLGLGQLRNGNFAQVLSGKGIMVPKHMPPGTIGWVWCANLNEPIWSSRWLRSDQCKTSKTTYRPIGESIQFLKLHWKMLGKTIRWWMIYWEKHGTTSGFHSIPARIRLKTLPAGDIRTLGATHPAGAATSPVHRATFFIFFLVEMGMDQT